MKEHGYFNLISGYKKPFKTQNGTYKKNASFTDIYLLYNFDCRLRHIFMEYLLKVEIHIKSLLSYSFSEQYGESQEEYLRTTNYNYNPEMQSGINKLIQKLTEVLDSADSFSYMKHQKENYNNVPLWVLLKAITFGSLSKMYSFQQPKIQSEISKNFFDINEKDLASMLDLLSRFRNVCAHNERLFDYRYKKHSICDTKLHSAFSIGKTENGYKKGKSDLFAIVISLKYLLSDNDFSDMVIKISTEINSLFDNTNQINKLMLYKYMGFPDNWEKIKDIDLHELVVKTSIH